MMNIGDFIASNIYILLLVFGLLIFLMGLIITTLVIGPKDKANNEVDRFSRQNIVRKQLSHALESRISEEKKSKVSLFIKRAGMDLTPGEYYLLKLIGAVVIGLITNAVLSNILVLIMGAGMGFVLPSLVLLKMKQKRSSKMDELSGEFLTLIIERTRNSSDFVSALRSAADHFNGREPLGSELKKTVEEISRLGYSVSEALDGLDERCDNKYMTNYVRSAKQAMAIGSADSFERLVGKNLEYYHADEKRASKKREKISSGKVEALIMVVTIPLVYFSQSMMFDWFFDFVLHTTLGQVATAIIMFIDLLLLWFTLFKVGESA